MERQTYFAKTGEVQPQWCIVDATDLILGRMSTKIATILMGKHKPQYTPHIDTGDYVIVINASKVKLTGRKLDQKFMKSYSGYPGGLKQVPYRKIRDEHPERLIERSVQRMLPKSSLGKKMLKKLKVYPGVDHPHVAQEATPLEL